MEPNVKKNAANPIDIARKTLEQLALRKMPPTPENYKNVYAEVSGIDAAKFDSTDNLERSLNTYIEYNPRLQSLGDSLKKSIKTVNWNWHFDEVRNYANKRNDKPNSADTPPAPVPAKNTELVNRDAEQQAKLLERFVTLFSQTLSNAFSEQPELNDEIQHLIEQIRQTKSLEQAEAFNASIQKLCSKAKIRSENKDKVHEGLVRLLRLLVQNIEGMVDDDEWLHGQIAVIQGIIANPIDRAAISDAERNLRNAIIKQNMLKNSMSNTKTQLKGLMTSFIGQLGDITSSTDDYHNKIEGYSQRITSSNNLDELGTLLNEIMQDTQGIQSSVSRSRQNLMETQHQAEEAEAKIKALEQELAKVSELVHQDQLTGALNRRGMDEVFEREAARADRSQVAMCVALLDIDNFKHLNDTLGHQAGDQALVHLSSLIKECIRPTDSVARFGGEEFVIIMPETDVQQGVQTVERLQRELTKKFFMDKNNPVLITFSAGVAQRILQESQEDVIGRADKAMYQAKKTGKNRVVMAE